MNGAELPPELRDRLRAYVEDVAPPGQVGELEARINEQLAGRATRQPAQVMAIAHETVSAHVRITPEAAAAALVDHGGLSPVVAAHIVGLPVDGVVSDASAGAPEPEPEPEPEPASALIAVAVAAGVVVLAVVGLLALGDGDVDEQAIGDPTPAVGGADEPDRAGTEPATGTDTTDPTEATGVPAPPGGAITVEDARVTTADGGTVRAGGSALLALTVGGTGNVPTTVQWELERDGEAVFAPAPLVVPADGEVRLTIPPALLADAGAYLVRVSQDGAVLLERDFEVTG